VSLDLAAFIRANTRLLPVPLVPEIRLYLADEATDLWQKTEDDLGPLNMPPPYWAFAWAGGQALARYILDHKEVVAGRRVLDFAAGSGLVAIAAAQAGAASIETNEIDAFAQVAIGLNAAENGVRIYRSDEDLIGYASGSSSGSPSRWDIVLAGDVSYERDMAARVTAWLEQLAASGTVVLIGDPGRAYLARDKLEAIAGYDVPVPRTIESADVKRAQVWRFEASSASGCSGAM